jgi:putative nucleotidyltransferase with HDIG domain
MIARCAAEISASEAALVLVPSDSGATPAVAATSCDAAAKLYASHRETFDEIAKLVLESGRPLFRSGAENPDAGLGVLAVAVAGTERPVAALIVASTTAELHLEDTDALSTLAGLASVALHNADLRDAQRNFFSHVTDILVQALDAHLDFHFGHAHRVAQLANRVGRALRLGDAELQRLHFAALLHDIGMLKLDRSQQMNRRTCDKHTLLGARMLARIRLWKDIAPIVQHHHESWDGHGYPEGLAGEAIPLESRIIAICDAYDTMTSEESYKQAVSPSEALAELDACAGTQFDPTLVQAFHGVADSEVAAPPPSDEAAAG